MLHQHVHTTRTGFLLATLLICSGAFAQTDMFFSSYLVKDDNIYKVQSEYQEWINTSTLYFGQTFPIGAFKVQGFYSADVSLFGNNSEQNNFSQQFGAVARWNKEQYALDIRADGHFRRNDAQYIYYNTNAFNFSTRLRYTPALTKSYTFGINASQYQYREFGDIDNFTYRLYGKYQQYFQSRMSISGEVGIGVKNYLNQTVINYFGNTGFGGPRRGLRISEEPVKSALFSVSGNVAKSISAKTGMNMSFGGQWFIGDPIQAYSETYGIYYFTENDLYDDPYSFQGPFVSLNLTRQFGVGFKGKVSAKFQKKYYSGTPALDENGDLLGYTREDSRQEYSLLLSKSFNTGWRFPKTINLNFNFMFRNNPSNDPYYDFNDTLGLIGFSISK